MTCVGSVLARQGSRFRLLGALIFTTLVFAFFCSNVELGYVDDSNVLYDFLLSLLWL